MQFLSVFLAVPTVVFVICLIAGVILSLFVGFIVANFLIKRKLNKAGMTAEKIIEDANQKAEEIHKEKLSECKEEVLQIKDEANREINDRKKAVQEMENKVNQREDRLDKREEGLNAKEQKIDAKERTIDDKERKIDDRKAEIEKLYNRADEIVQEQEKKLVEISELNKEKAREIVLNRVEEDMSKEIAVYIKDQEEKAKEEVKRKSQCLLANAIQQYANDAINEKTVSVVALPNDEMKGRIIGREGRNIRSIEAATGVDIIIDDTPEAVVLSCFDPIRREIARRTMETLVQDGRIQPPRIEELVSKYKRELDVELKEAGEKAVFDTGIGKIHPDLVKLIGR